MVLILNLLLIVVGVGALALAYKLRKIWPIVVALVIMFLISFARPSYMPKGVVERVALPEYEAKELQIQDRNRAPVAGSDRDAAREQKIRDGMEWYKQIKQTEEGEK